MIGSIYLATPVGMDVGRAEYLQRSLAYKFCGGRTNAVHLASKVFEAKFTEMGSWDAYINHVAKGVDFAFRLPTFSIICCVQPTLGRATAQIVERALVTKRQVCLIQEDEGLLSLSKVSGVETTDHSPPFLEWRHNETGSDPRTTHPTDAG